MEPNEIFCVDATNIAAGSYVTSLPAKPVETFTDEKKLSSKKNTAKVISESPAPFYDELHFGNYE